MRLLTLDDLCDYYSNHKNMVNYNADKNSNCPVVVQLEATMTFSDDDYDPELALLKTHLKSCHIGTNRNKSSIERSVMEEAKASIYNRPILGFIHQLSDGSFDFAGHEMFINDDGEVEYEEIPVGCIPESGNAHLVYDEENDKTYLEVDGIIFEEYTRAASILKEKKESKVSVELALLDYSYNPKEKEMVINRFYFSGITILGKDRYTEEPISEGMYGSKITLKDFKQNNSMFANQTDELNSKLIETLDALNSTLSKFNIDDSKESIETYERREIEVENQEILVNEEVVETEEIIENSEETIEETVEVTEVESTEEVIETEEVEDPVEDDTPEVVEEESEETSEEEPADEVIATEELEEEPVEEVVENNYELIERSFEFNGRKFSVSFELSHEDIHYGLYHLLEKYDESDNEWYGIRAVYDDYFVFQGWCTGKIFGQKYSTDGDTVALDGERWELFEELLTASEKAELESMRSNYAALAQFKADTESAQIHAERQSILSNEKYSVLAEKDENNEYKNEAYAKLVSEMDNYSLTDLEKELKSVFADYITNGGQFAYAEEEKPAVNRKLFAAPTSKKTSRYGNLFSK